MHADLTNWLDLAYLSCSVAVMTKKPDPDAGAMLHPSEAAQRLHVSTRTLTRMADRGDLHVVKLPSGHRRYLVAEVDALLPESAKVTAA